MIKNFGPKIYTLAADYNFGQLSAALDPRHGAHTKRGGYR